MSTFGPIPNGRTGNYSLWRVCERFKLVPPGIDPVFNENTSWNQARLLAYEFIREHEEDQRLM